MVPLVPKAAFVIQMSHGSTPGLPQAAAKLSLTPGLPHILQGICMPATAHLYLQLCSLRLKVLSHAEPWVHG